MSARLVVLLCLLSVGAMAASSEHVFAGSDEIVVFLHPQMDYPATLGVAMWQEANSLLRLAGYRMRLLDSPHPVSAAFLVIVDLEGACAWNPPALALTTKTLASTRTEGDRILPFIRVNCTALQEFLAPAVASRPDSQFLYGRALGRLLAHELYHVVGQTTIHTRTGVTQAAVSRDQLIADHFTFCPTAVGRVRPLGYFFADPRGGR